MVQDFFHQQYVYISRSMYSKKMYIPPRSPLKGDVIYPMNTHYINLYGVDSQAAPIPRVPCHFPYEKKWVVDPGYAVKTRQVILLEN